MSLEENPDNKYNIVLSPYLNMGQTKVLDFGFGKIWNFDLLKGEYIPNGEMRAQVEKTVVMYRSNNSYNLKHHKAHGPITGVGIFNYNPDLTQEENNNNLRSVRYITFISFVSQNNTVRLNSNTGHSMVTSDNFLVAFLSLFLGYISHNRMEFTMI